MKCGFENVRLADAEHDLALVDEYRATLKERVAEGGYGSHESVINLPDDEYVCEQALALAREKGGNLSYIIVVGIGGSNLGTEAVYNALRPSGAERPRMLFAETVDARAMEHIISLVSDAGSLDEILVCVVSKSGRTTETVANAEMLREALVARFGEEAQERFVAITDEGSPLWSVAEEAGITAMAIPENVPGRYSVFSAVGLVPLACAGFDIEALHAGARDMRDRCLQEDDPAAQSALSLLYYMREGYRIHDTFLFDPVFASLGGWYRQLLAESVGKAENRDGAEVHAGITPTTSIGSRDLHSIGQLALGGPRERVTTFVRRGSTGSSLSVSDQGVFSRTVEELSGKTSEDILSALAESAQIAYAEAGLPFIDVFLEELSEYELGAFLQWKMMEVMYLAHLMNVNAFDQPAVEAFKRAARNILLKKEQ